MAKNKCYLCNKEPCDCWHVCATDKQSVCMKCMPKYRAHLSAADKRKDMIIKWDDGHVQITDLSPYKS
jgi:hypothetical protein